MKDVTQKKINNKSNKPTSKRQTEIQDNQVSRKKRKKQKQWKQTNRETGRQKNKTKKTEKTDKLLIRVWHSSSLKNSAFFICDKLIQVAPSGGQIS